MAGKFYYDRKKKVPSILLWRESFITTGKKKSSISFVVAGKFYYDWKKKVYLFCCGRKVLLRPEKKDTIVCLAGARSLLRPEKKDTVVCLLGARFWRLRPEKKDTVVCLAGCAVVSVFGSGGKLAFFCSGGKF